MIWLLVGVLVMIIIEIVLQCHNGILVIHKLLNLFLKFIQNIPWFYLLIIIYLTKKKFNKLNGFRYLNHEYSRFM